MKLLPVISFSDLHISSYFPTYFKLPTYRYFFYFCLNIISADPKAGISLEQGQGIFLQLPR